MLFYDSSAPRWIIFLIDIITCLFTLTLAYLLRFNFASIPQSEISTFPLVFAFMIGTRAISFLVWKTYSGIVRYTSSKDAQRIFIATTITSLFFALTNLITYFFISKSFVVPYSIIVIEYMATTFLLISLRLIFKAIYLEVKNPSRTKTNVIIFGAGESGIITKRTLDRDAGMKYKVLAFIDFFFELRKDDLAKDVGRKPCSVLAIDLMGDFGLVRKVSLKESRSVVSGGDNIDDCDSHAEFSSPLALKDPPKRGVGHPGLQRNRSQTLVGLFDQISVDMFL